MAKTKGKSSSRRKFLKTAGLVTAAAGVTVVSAKVKPAKAVKLKTTGHARYKETDHVRTYYELARF
jgi:hypothetical protein